MTTPPVSEEPKLETVGYVMRYGGRCRDCADNDGICPNSGLPCDPKLARQAIRRVLDAVHYGITNGFLRSGSLAQEGWKVVPLRATREMQEAGAEAQDDDDVLSAMANIYRAMVSAAPTPPTDGEES